ncbi:MAG: hypothetical protein IJM79_04035 [Erysipelotrichaceae bacterium]|nr:hypothetical protein [Erysipelotrichaceae bacterium]
MKRNYRRALLLVISCLSLLASGYICYKINTDIPQSQTDPSAAPEPVVLSFQNREEGIRIQWKASPGAVNYRVVRKEKSGLWEVYDYTENTWYDDNAVEDGVTYYYKVYGIGQVKTGKASEAVKVLRLAKPQIVLAEKQEGGIALSWQEVKTAGYYYVYRSGDGEKFEKISDRIRELMYLDASVSPGNTYYYCVKAANSNNTYISVRSDVVSIEY